MDVEESVREIEVTAKSIVDRIQGNTSTENKLDRPGKLQRVSLSSTYGDKPPGQDGGGGPDVIPVPNPNPSVDSGDGSRPEEQNESEYVPELSEHDKKAKILLSALTKWMRESIQNENSERSAHIAVPENFHWVYGVESYIKNFCWSSQKALTNKIMIQFMNWFKQLFHFKEKRKDDEVEFNRVLAHWEINRGMISITKLNLYSNFPNYAVSGVDAFEEDGRTPIIYCSDETVGHQVATRIGLPHKYVDVINPEDPEWVSALEQNIMSNKEKRVPLVIILNVDTPNLLHGCRLAEAYSIWVHLYGANLIPYLIARPENTQIGSSFTIDLKWLKNPSLPYLTLYKSGKSDSSLLELCELSSPNMDTMIFTPWFILNVVGHDEVRSIVNEGLRRGKFLHDMVQKYSCLNLVPNWVELSDGSKIITSITFQYNPPYFNRNGDVVIPEGGEEEEANIVRPSVSYVDTLNSWLYHIMDRDLKDFIPVEFICAENGGWNIHIDVSRCEPEDENVVTFDHHLSVLQSTVAQKQIFSRLVQDFDELLWVDHESQWAGLGAVRYLPAFHRNKPEEDSSNVSKPTDESIAGMKENVDHLNAQIVDKLKAIDTAFSLGECATGEWCIQFGMVTMETDVAELVRLVISTGQEIEESSEFFKRMSEILKQGIEKATEELKRESEEALWEEGILRRVPVVGTFVNWLSPPAKESGVRGRALNLTQGKVESTENIYKYHMQIEACPTSHGSSNN